MKEKCIEREGGKLLEIFYLSPNTYYVMRFGATRVYNYEVNFHMYPPMVCFHSTHNAEKMSL